MNLPIPAETRVPEKLNFFFKLIWFSQNICCSEVGIPPHTPFSCLYKKNPAGFLVFEQMTEKSVQHMRAVIAESSENEDGGRLITRTESMRWLMQKEKVAGGHHNPQNHHNLIRQFLFWSLTGTSDTSITIKTVHNTTLNWAKLHKVY